MGCTNKNVEEPKIDGSTIIYEVLFDHGKLVSGKEAMKRYYGKTNNKETLSIKIIQNYLINEEEKESITIITYDNDKYRHKNGDSIKEYLYLNYSIHEAYTSSSIYRNSESYCLTNDKNITSEDIMSYWLSSVLLEPTDGIIIYTEYQYKDICFI